LVLGQPAPGQVGDDQDAGDNDDEGEEELAEDGSGLAQNDE
jgi:hypothetical protein